MKNSIQLFLLTILFAGIFAFNNVNAQTTLISSDFETLDPTVWSFANVAATNQWYIGTATANGGVQSAYISSDGGVTNSYVITVASTNHIYTSVTFPAGETAILLSFDWRGVAEPSATGGSTFDYIRVSLMAAAPVGGTFPVVGEQLPVIFTGQPGYVKAWVVIPASFAGTTRNLVITWRDDTSLGTPTPGPSIDNVSLISNTPTALTGTITVPGTYSSVGQAIANLNAHGVGAGGVTISLTAGTTFTETPPAITATGTVANPILFQRTGAGANPKITATGTGNFGPTSTSSVTGSGDAVLAVNGGDYITFDGIDVSVGNFVGTSSCIEAGYLIRNISATDGAQNNTIQNTNIVLNRTNTGSAGIIQTATTTAGGIVPTSAAGANSLNKYYNLSISNAYGGVNLLGTAAFPDLNAEVGTTGGGSTTIGASYGGTPTPDIGGLATSTFGIQVSSQSGYKISNCTIRNIGSTATSRGISGTTGLGNSEIFNNQIYGIRSFSTTSTSGVNGIDVALSTTVNATVKIYNNFVYDLSSAYTGAASGTRQMRGILLGSGTANGVYNVDFNSIYIDGSGAPTISNTCIELGGTTAKNNIRNNIFGNFTGSQSGIAKHYCIRSTSATAMGGTGSVCNNNVYYINNSTNGFMGLTNTTDRIAIADWITALNTAHPGIDTNSKSHNPQFTSSTNLHINPSISTPVENNGSYFAGTITWVTNDIDGNTRNVTTPDIGADEGTFTPLVNNDIQATAFVSPTNGAIIALNSTVTPQASFTNNGLNAQTNVTVRYRILDPSSTEVYNQTAVIASIASGATSTVTFPVSGALSVTGTYTIKAYSELVGDEVTSNDSITGSITTLAPLAGDYTIGVALFNRVSGKNITFERVVKKVLKEVYVSDVTSTVSKSEVNKEMNSVLSSTGKMVIQEVEEVSFVPMENGKEYTGPLYLKRSGNENLIGDAGIGFYATITAAVNDLNAVGISAAVRFLLLDATYPSETFPIVVNTIAASSSTNTVSILPNTGVTSTVSGSTTSAIFKLNGADYFIIDGSNNGSSSRDLTITNTNVAGLGVWIGSASVSNGATNNTIKNCNISGNTGTSTIAGIITGSGSVLGGDAESPNSNTTIQNNVVTKMQNGLYMRGNSTTLDQDNVVTGNTFGSTVALDKLGFRGMLIGNSQNVAISNNTMMGVQSSTTSTATMQGIQVALNMSGGSISKNVINDIKQINTGGWGAVGILLGAATTASNLTVSNNFIWDVTGFGFAGVSSADNGYGIMVVLGGGYNIYFNSVSMNTNQTAAGSITAALNVELNFSFFSLLYFFIEWLINK